MDYIETFLSGKETVSRLEKIALSYSVLNQVKEELFNKNYKPKLDKDYYSEDKLVSWIDVLSQTHIFKFFKHYFNVNIVGAENIPSKTGALLVANHSTIFLADLAPIYIGVYEKKRRWLYGLAYKMVGNSDLLKTVGAVKGKRELGIKILEEDKLAIACPGGIMEACKPFYDRYKIKPVEGFAPKNCGYVKTAWAANKPIIPTVSIGAEETIIILANIKPFVNVVMQYLNKKRLVKNNHFFKKLSNLVDFAKIIPLPLNLFPFKTNVTAYVSQPINVRSLIGNSPTQKDFNYVNTLVMKKLQDMINIYRKQ